MENVTNKESSVLEEVKKDLARNAKQYAKSTIDVLFEFFGEQTKTIIKNEEKRKETFQIIAQILKKPETEQVLSKKWSESLYEKGLICEAYSRLPDEYLIHNFKQDGYNAGRWVGYFITMMALIENNAPDEIIDAVDNYYHPYFGGQLYEDAELIEEKYKSLIDKRKEVKGQNS